MKDQSAVILWDGNVPWSDIEQKINLLTEYQVRHICVATASVPATGCPIPGVAMIHEVSPLGSVGATMRGINYIKTSFWQQQNADTSGIFVINSNARLAGRLLSKMLQVSTALPLKGVDFMIGLQLVTDSKKIKYVLNSSSIVESFTSRDRGHEFVGALYIRTLALSHLSTTSSNKIETVIQDAILNKKQVYGVVYECCDSLF